ncbi:MAG: hypothetical protein F4086_06030 [Gemmatimonadetes bacterium]|nr:hypothetical protein [Gammaproteobacteria bacterium]MYE94861.1 hypothetical protein [Gemmatimonadota bacterium]MYJ09855.1 hypothetical protein [Gemmatimonadota bacterium]
MNSKASGFGAINTNSPLHRLAHVVWRFERRGTRMARALRAALYANREDDPLERLRRAGLI